MYLDEGERRPGRDRDALGPRVPVEGSQPCMILESTAVGSCSFVAEYGRPVVSERGRGVGSHLLAVKVPS